MPKRDDITIAARDGAHVFVNDGGRVTMEQDRLDEERERLCFQPDEAKAVAAALIEVADAAIEKRRTNGHL